MCAYSEVNLVGFTECFKDCNLNFMQYIESTICTEVSSMVFSRTCFHINRFVTMEIKFCWKFFFEVIMLA